MNPNQNEIQLFDELSAGGIPLNEDVLRELKDTSDELQLYQSPNSAENAIFDQVAGETLYMLGVVIANVSERIIRLQACRLKSPWPESNFRWLENPWGKIPPEYTYAHPAFGPAGFEPEVILNHRFKRGCKLFPGDWLDGLLLGIGEAPVPEEYVDRQAIPMKLSIFEGRGTCHVLNMKLIVRGSKQRKQPPSHSNYPQTSSLSKKRGNLVATPR